MEPADKQEQLITEKKDEVATDETKTGKEEGTTSASEKSEDLVLIDAIKSYLAGIGVDPNDKSLTRDQVISTLK